MRCTSFHDILPGMWTPLLLICYVDSTDCAIPNAPVYYSEEECWAALDHVVETYKLPEGMAIMAHECYNWGTGS